MLWRVKKKYKDVEPKPPLPKWAVWAIFLCIIYLVVIGNVSRLQKPAASPELANAASKEPTLETSIGNAITPEGDYPAIRATFNVSNWQRAFNPTLKEGLQSKDQTIGKGRAVACGDTVTVRVDAKTVQGTPIDSELYNSTYDSDQSLSFTLGMHTVFPALEQSMIGMKVGGSRIVDAPPALVFDDVAVAQGLSNLVLYIDLLAVSPAFEKNRAPLLVSPAIALDDEAMVCGTSMVVATTIWDSLGKQMAHKERLSLTLGDKTTPLGLSQALIGLEKGATRTVTLPPHYQTHEGKGFAALDGKELRIVEVKRLE